MQLTTLFYSVTLLFLIVNMYEATPIIESRATRPRRKLYDFQFSWTNSSDSEDRTGEAGFKVLGHMRDFGRIEEGSSFTYDGDPDFGQSFSNEFNIGTSDEDTNKPISGLGGGYTFNETNLDVGAGISAFDQKVNFQLDIGKGGNVFIHFDLSGSSAAKLNCQPDNTTATANDTVGMTCIVQTSS